MQAKEYVDWLCDTFPNTYTREYAESWAKNEHVSFLAWQAARAQPADLRSGDFYDVRELIMHLERNVEMGPHTACTPEERERQWRIVVAAHSDSFEIVGTTGTVFVTSRQAIVSLVDKIFKALGTPPEWQEYALNQCLVEGCPGRDVPKPTTPPAQVPAVWHDVVAKLITLAHATNIALDDSEEREGDDGREHAVSSFNFDAVCRALDALEELPDDKPGYALDAAGKACWALRDLLALAAAPQPKGGE